MNSTRLLFLAGLLCMALSTTYAVHQSKDTKAEVALQAAIKTETIDGNLKAAIEQYRKITSTYKDNRAVVAKALVRMGACYERLGDKDARAAYQRVVTDFADQQASASEARARLGALTSGKPVSAGASFRQISKIPGSVGAISPDGLHLVYVNDNDGKLWIRDISTGAERNLAEKDDGLWDSPPLWSPDGSRIAYITADKVWIIKLNGMDVSDKSKAFEAAKDDSLFILLGWLPEGNSILAYFERSKKLAKISVADGSVKNLDNLQNMPSIDISSGMLSPGARYVACQGTRVPRQWEIIIVPLAGGEVVPLTSDKGIQQLLGWDAEGRSVLFASDRGGSYDLWRAEVLNGKPTGKIEQIRPDIGVADSLGFAKNGSICFKSEKRYSDLNVSTINLIDGNVAWPYITASVGKESYFNMTTWSPDGERLAYLAAANGMETNPTSLSSMLGIWSPQHGRELEIKLPTPVHIQPFSWSRDRKSILGWSGGPGKWSLIRVDAESGKTEILFSGEKGNVLGWSPDASQIYVMKSDSTHNYYYAVNIADGKEMEIFRYPRQILWNNPISPDGKWLAVASTPHPPAPPTTQKGIIVISTAGGENCFLMTEAKNISAPNWTSDSRNLICSMQYQGNSGRWVVPIDGGAPHKLDKLPNSPKFSFNPDGKRVAFITTKAIEEVWVMENLPPLKASGK
jgi:Tol biopolymer transport system component